MDATTVHICRICDGSMIDPRILPCSHSFCLKCLESKTATKCMTCQIDFEVPRGGLKELKKNVFIERLQILKQDFICNSCQECQAIKFCTDCSINYCKTCLVHHKNFPLTRDHKLDAINIKSAKGKREKEFDSKSCKEHDETMSIFCFDCSKLACVRCVLSEHNGHHLTHISNYSKDSTTILTTNLKEQNQILKEVVDNQEQIVDIMTRYLCDASKLKKEIIRRGGRVKSVIDTIIDELQKDVDNNFEQLHTNADDVLSKLKDMETKLRAQINILEYGMSDLNEKKFIEPTLLKNKNEIVPKYIDKLDLLFLPNDSETLKSDLQGLFGTLTESLICGTFQFTLHNIDKCCGVFYSPACYIRNLPWRIKIEPNRDTQNDKQFLSFHLNCNQDLKSKSWSCHAEFELRILNNLPNGRPNIFNFSALFNNKQYGFGRKEFISMNDLLNGKNGYVNNDNVTFEVYLKANRPSFV